MSRGVLRWLLAASLALVLAVAVFWVRGYERTLAEGRVVLFELAPVDPRSMMQGDFMALDFAVNREMQQLRHATGEEGPAPTYARIYVDAEGRGTFAGFAEALPAPGDPFVGVRLQFAHGLPHIGPDAFFFQEGTAERYEAAAFGEFRVADDGTVLLTGLRDIRLEPLGEVQR